MIRALLFLISLCFGLTVKADLPGPAYQYDRYSENGKYFFKSIPFYNYHLTDFGKTIVYDTESKKELYKIDNYLPTKSFISNTGRTLVTTTFWMFGHSDFEAEKLVEIFIDEKSTVQYFIDDLVSDKSQLFQTVSHTLWYDKMFVKNDTLFIQTLEEKVVLISLATGEIIFKLDRDNCSICGYADKLPEPKNIYYKDIKYPAGLIFPDLVTEKPFRASLISALNKTETKNYSDCKYSILVYGAIDKSGNCEIFMLNANVNGNEDKDWTNQVSNWIISQKYKTDLIPQNCDKWVFQEYFYLQ